MMKRFINALKRFHWQQWVVLGAFLFAIGFTTIFVVHSVRSAHSWRHHQRDESIRGWMTLHYIAHSYHVPASVVYGALGMQEVHHDRTPVRVIAQRENKSMEQVRESLLKAIAEYRATAPSPSAAPRTSNSPTLSGGSRR